MQTSRLTRRSAMQMQKQRRSSTMQMHRQSKLSQMRRNPSAPRLRMQSAEPRLRPKLQEQSVHCSAARSTAFPRSSTRSPSFWRISPVRRAAVSPRRRMSSPRHAPRSAMTTMFRASTASMRSLPSPLRRSARVSLILTILRRAQATTETAGTDYKWNINAMYPICRRSSESSRHSAPVIG